ncbi:type VI secretion system Vgr family protein [Roseateles sp. BYS180W]|uniref:Type VI secretion system Vgr family protein n=1 Tax=Roseateles rivi TaxID=3299028 RepID=A0ABW7FSB8_9BURK
MNLMDMLGRLLSDTTRMYRLQASALPEAGLLVEAFSLREALDEPWLMQVSALSASVHIEPQQLLGQCVSLWARLADGSEHPRSGVVTQASADSADGGLARYVLTVEPWLALLGHHRRSQVWQERSVVEIVESVFAQYPLAAWHWAPCVQAHLQDSSNAGVRSYTVQYRESDLAFVQRLLAREGIGLRLEQHESAPAQHRLVLFADSANPHSCVQDAVSAASVGGVRFHGTGAQQGQDAIYALGGARRLPVASTTVLSWDYKNKRAVAASVPTAQSFGGANAPHLEDYDDPGAYAFADEGQAERAARLMQQSHEARHKRWLGRSTVRSFTAGQWFDLQGSELDLLARLSRKQDAQRFLLTHVVHAGQGNLPKTLQEQVRAQLGDVPGEVLQAPWVDEALRQQVLATGYANRFEALRAGQPWRPQLVDGSGARRHVAPTVSGLLCATVVGSPEGGADDVVHTDALGRVRISFDFQQAEAGPSTSTSSSWVRVLQRWAGSGMGAQFIPRVGQEVLVDFVGGDIERPLVVGALYNGQGEVGEAFAHSTDASAAAQGNVKGGHSPAWHAAAPGVLGSGGQANAGALSGIKTQELGGTGYNQLVLDDTPGQLRVQLGSTQYASQLNLGHLIHQSDNHRGGLRGQGWELRSDAYGALRAESGVLVSSYGARASEGAGDAAAAQALAGQLKVLAQGLNQAAVQHQSVALGAQQGAPKANASALNSTQAPVAAHHTALKGMVDAKAFDAASSDAQAHQTSTGQSRVPQLGGAIIELASRASTAVVAGQDLQIAAQEAVVLGAGGALHAGAGGAVRLHSGQALGLLAGAIEPGSGATGSGLTLIAAQGDVQLQAQADSLQIAAQGELSIQSQSGEVNWGAAKRIVLATAGGASVVIEGGNITLQCPGKLTVQAGRKSFKTGQQQRVGLPTFPASVCVPCLMAAMKAGSPFAMMQ